MKKLRFDPPTPSLDPDEMMKEVMLMQPNNLTFASYTLSPIQENVMTLIMDALQAHVSHVKPLNTDLFNQPYVEIQADEAGGENHKARVIREIADMRQKTFNFKWQVPDSSQKVETTGSIITTWHDYKGTNNIRVNFNIWAIPFLLYYGVGVGGTRFSKRIALDIHGNYTKRIYKMISRWKDKTQFEYNLMQFRADLQIPNSYTNESIKRRILIKSRDAIKSIDADVWFDFKLFAKHTKPGLKSKSDTILFTIFTKTENKIYGQTGDAVYNYLYYWLSEIYGKGSDKILKAFDEINRQGAAQKVYDRCKYIENLLKNGHIDNQSHANNSVRKYLRETFKIDIK